MGTIIVFEPELSEIERVIRGGDGEKGGRVVRWGENEPRKRTGGAIRGGGMSARAI